VEWEVGAGRAGRGKVVVNSQKNRGLASIQLYGATDTLQHEFPVSTMLIRQNVN